MLSDEEKQTIDYLKARLYGNEGCKFIDVAQSDLRIFLKLVENLQKDIESWKKYCNEQENDITLKNNKICDLEFKIEKQSKEIEELKENNKNLEDELNKYIVKMSDEQYRRLVNIIRDEINKLWEDKIKAKIEELEEYLYKGNIKDDFLMIRIKAKIQELQSLLEKE